MPASSPGWSLPEPMRAVPVTDPALPAGWAAQLKWDGYRALVGRWADGRVAVRSRNGGDLTASFPEIEEAVRLLPDDTAVDGELVVWEGGRLAFERLQQRMHRRGAAATRAAGELPAHLVAFDLLRLNGQGLTGWPFSDRYAALQELFLKHHLAAPWSLCATTTDPVQAAAWLADYPAVGIEGLVFRPLASRYVPGGRGWTKYKMRHTTEAVVGAVTGSLTAPTTALLGRYDDAGRLRYAGRTTTLSTTARQTLAGQLRTGGADYPWTGRTFSAGWSSREHLSVRLVVPEAVAEVAVDVARDSPGRWRHPVRFTRIRADMTLGDVPLFGAAP
ncbi:ATP-dependent DNA ligase [Streptomyces aquilus]|uniref:ATP-dependent DNA ligase n=1 Tax=Streptomyces aquilus TaxID=2548456 RepID=A0A3Q9C7T1_9ACTN|nr:ATP-dependent DNA ligase [Streptomyces aquilus]AZP14739.1 ATP-dependent DNA ligase [Streptomyces aquilus]AZP22965.1 ATP-dependent DNA ligase [Streptomyces aquilus]